MLNKRKNQKPLYVKWGTKNQKGKWRQQWMVPSLLWRDVLSNLSELSLSLNFRTGSDLSNLPGPSPPLYRWRNSSSKGLFQGHTASEKQSQAQPGPGPSVTSHWGHTGAAAQPTGPALLEASGSCVTSLTMNFNKMSYWDVSNLKALQNSVSEICLVMRITSGTCQKLKSPGPFLDPPNQFLQGEGPGRLNF